MQSKTDANNIYFDVLRHFLRKSQSDQENTQVFGDTERLMLHQLRVLESLYDTVAAKEADSDHQVSSSVPQAWVLTKGVDALYPWQEEARRQWFERGGKGTLKVVTGAGKTILALAIAEQLQNSSVPGLRVAIVVPTIALMHQWVSELKKHANLPASAIGELYGDSKDSFADGKRIIVGVLPTVAKKLATDVRRAEIGKKLLLIGDECHHFNQSRGEKTLQTPHTYTLGLSATPESGDDSYAESIPGRGFGPVIYELSLRQAQAQGILPPYTINHYGLKLTPEERHRYEQLSRKISDARKDLNMRAPAGRFFGWVQSQAKSDGESGQLAREFLAASSRRDALLYGMNARHNAVKLLLAQIFKENKHARVILFHERITETNQLFVELRAAGYAAVLEHSELADSLRERSLDLFRDGVAQVLVSVRSLVEGFNVPAADVGIIVAASSSSRQRIQSLGRIMRRYKGAQGVAEKAIHILYAANTKDENIYAKLDWGEITGDQKNHYFLWDLNIPPMRQNGPPQQPTMTDDKIMPEALSPGCTYEGAYEGEEFSCDTRGNIENADGVFARNTGDLVDKIRAVKGSAGRFRVTPRRRYVLIRDHENNVWTTRFVTQLKEALDFSPQETAQSNEATPMAWAEDADVGDPYPFEELPIEEIDLSFSQKRGGVIEKRLSNKRVWARCGPQANDPLAGEEAMRALNAIRQLRARGMSVTKLLLNEAGHLLTRQGGNLYFIHAFQNDLEFPE